MGIWTLARKNNVVSFSRKGFCALAIGFGLRLGLQLTEIRLNTFSVKRSFG